MQEREQEEEEEFFKLLPCRHKGSNCLQGGRARARNEAREQQAKEEVFAAAKRGGGEAKKRKRKRMRKRKGEDCCIFQAQSGNGPMDPSISALQCVCVECSL